MKKKIRKDIIVVFVEIIVVIILICFTYVYRANYKRNQSLKNIFYSEDITAVSGEKSTDELEYNISKKHGLTFSNFYQNEAKGLLQIRFQVLSLVPFAHEDIFTKISLTDGDGKSYSENITSFGASNLKRRGSEIIISFQDEDIPKKGTKFYLNIDCAEDNDEPFGSAEISFEIK